MCSNNPTFAQRATKHVQQRKSSAVNKVMLTHHHHHHHHLQVELSNSGLLFMPFFLLWALLPPPPFFGNNLDQDEHLKLFSTCRTPIRVLQGLHLASYSSMSYSHPDWSCFAQRRAGACFLPSFPSAATKAGTWFLPSCITTSLKSLAIPFLDTLQKNVLWNKHIIKSSSEKKWEIKRN